jgi:hypothetical protein
MVTSVLRLWAHDVQLRLFRGWRAFVDDRIDRRFKTAEALQIYQNRCLRLSLTGFILAAQRLPAVLEDESGDELLSSSSSSIELEMPKIEASKLTPPKRPAFLVPRRVEAVCDRLESKFMELKARLESAEPQQKQEMIDELNDLMREIARWSARAEEE